MIRALGGATVFAPTGRATLGLGITQIIGWGTTFLMPGVLGRAMQGDLGLPTEAIFAGITVSYTVGAVLSPHIGRLMDRTGSRLIMSLGSLVFAASIALLAAAQGAVVYFLAWTAMGIASTLALNTPASIALAQVAGARARQAIAILAIIGGFASTVFWPFTGALASMLGWRGALLVFAAMHIAICLPIHFFALPRTAPAPATTTATSTAGGGVPAEQQPRVYMLLNISLATGAFVYTGFIIHAIEILRGVGHTTGMAVFLASLIGPSQVGIRIFELLFGHRYSFMMSAIMGSAMLPFGLGLMLLDGSNSIAVLICVLAYGISNGLKAVQRATLPLALFGRAQFGFHMGRLAVAQGVMSAAAPTVLAAVLDHFGASGALWLDFFFSMVSLITMIQLARLAKSVR
jgi:predicted MFS family arabinose efflux permease